MYNRSDLIFIFYWGVIICFQSFLYDLLCLFFFVKKKNFKILNFKLLSYEKNYWYNEVMNIINFDVYCRFFVVLLWVLK